MSLQRVCLLVAGMHRSGTSAVARVLSLLGAALPRTLMEATPSNEVGHWEPSRIVAYNDRLLAELDSHWDDVRALDLVQLSDTRRQQIVAQIAGLITDDFGDAPLFVLKDPRLCRLLPLYLDALASLDIDARIVVPYRHPGAVAASLFARDAIAHGYAMLLWLCHVLDAEHASRGLPRYFVSYEAMLDDWHSATASIARSLSLTWPVPASAAAAAIDAFLLQRLQHQLATVGPLPPWITDACEALASLHVDPSGGDATARLDALRSSTRGLDAGFGSMLFEDHSQRTEEALVARKRLAAADATNIALQADLSTARQRIRDVEASTSWRITAGLRAVKRVLSPRLRRA
jgi:hypothetical protein